MKGKCWNPTLSNRTAGSLPLEALFPAGSTSGWNGGSWGKHQGPHFWPFWFFWEEGVLNQVPDVLALPGVGLGTDCGQQGDRVATGSHFPSGTPSPPALGAAVPRARGALWVGWGGASKDVPWLPCGDHSWCAVLTNGHMAKWWRQVLTGASFWKDWVLRVQGKA